MAGPPCRQGQGPQAHGQQGEPDRLGGLGPGGQGHGGSGAQKGSLSSVPAGFEKRLLDNRPLGGPWGLAPGPPSP